MCQGLTKQIGKYVSICCETRAVCGFQNGPHTAEWRNLKKEDFKTFDLHFAGGVKDAH